MSPVALIGGAVVGAGLFLLVFALIPRRASLSQRLAAFDAQRSAVLLPQYADTIRERDSAVSRRLGNPLAAFCAEQGWEFPSLRANLALADKSFESFLASKVLLGLFGLLLAPLMLAAATAAGLRVPFEIPVWLGLVLGAVFFLLPDLEVKQKADQRRKDFRHAVGAFLDLVSMNLAGGRGVPEALMSASEMGGGWSMSRIRDALANARISGHTPWQALGGLAEEVKVDELRDLATTLSLVADDGAKVRESLTARAASLRRRQLTDLEGQAGERSQSMLVAQMVLVMGFLVFLAYPVIPALIGI
jgi:tight adherence protein C